MPLPGLTADRSLYRSRRHYRSRSSTAVSTTGSMVAPTQDGATCCDAVACKECPPGYACLWYGDVSRCLPPHHLSQRSTPRFLTAVNPGHYPWPYHCASSDGHAEIYCHSGCLAGPTDVQCLGPGPWGVAEEIPMVLKA